MKVVCTGSAGFIGGAVVQELEGKGHEVISFDRAHGLDVLADPIPKADAVIHLCGVLGTAELFDTPHLAVDVNVSGTLNVLEACKKYGMRYVGIAMLPVFPSIYTATKVCATRLASAYHFAYGLGVSHVRAFNAFGIGQKYGHGHPRKIVPAFSVEAWRGEPITIWGDGEQTVDLVHTSALGRMLAQAIFFTDDEMLDGGTGQAFTVNQVAEMVLDITGSRAGTRHLPMRKGEIPTNVVAEGEGWDKLGWRPEFDEALFEATVRSYRDLALEAA